MKTLDLYFSILVPLSISLAVFEIWLERFKKGEWGKTEFDHPFWGRKIRMPVLLAYVTPYHIAMFGIVIPGITIGILSHCGMSVSSVIFVSAVWIGNTVLEDLLWFAIQSLTGWREPEALLRLLAGDFAWHRSWISLPLGIKLPRWYAVGTAISAILLAIVVLAD